MNEEYIDKEKYNHDMDLFKDVIAHWTRLATGKSYITESIGEKHCAFCREYRDMLHICNPVCPFILINGEECYKSLAYKKTYRYFII